MECKIELEYVFVFCIDLKPVEEVKEQKRSCRFGELEE